MDQVAKKHWKNGFNYQYAIGGKKKCFWSCSLRIGRFGIMIRKPSRIVSFINVYELI